LNKLQAIFELWLYTNAVFLSALARILFENKRLWDISLSFKRIPRKRVDKEKFAKLMSRITK